MGPSVTDIDKGPNTSTGFGNVSSQRSPYKGQNNNYDQGSYKANGALDQPLRSKTKSRSRSPTDRIVDIQTEDNQYTEIFSWGADYQGQLGLGINLTGD